MTRRFCNPALGYWCAGYGAIPIHKRALRIVAQRPDLQFEEGWDIEAVCTVDVKKGFDFPEQHAGIRGQPGSVREQMLCNVCEAPSTDTTTGLINPD